jgi:hypothetical protein
MLSLPVFFQQEFDASMLFATSFSAAHIEKWPQRPKNRHAFDMAEGKLDMHPGSGKLFARTLLLVNLQPAQTGSAMSSCCQKRRAEARRWHSARQNLRNGHSKFGMILANSTCPRYQKI